MSSAEVVCCKSLPSITDELSIEANSVDPEQTAPIGAVWSGPTLFAKEVLKHFSRREKQTTFGAIGALRVKNKRASTRGNLFIAWEQQGTVQPADQRLRS